MEGNDFQENFIMEHFVTIFDRLFIPQGLSLLLSMQRHINDFTLWVICMDEKTRDVLDAYNAANLKLLEIKKLETEQLLNLKIYLKNVHSLMR